MVSELVLEIINMVVCSTLSGYSTQVDFYQTKLSSVNTSKHIIIMTMSPLLTEITENEFLVICILEYFCSLEY